MGCVEAGLHPGVDILAAFDLPFVDVRLVAERFQLLADPLRKIMIALRIADEEIGHSVMIGSGESRCKPRIVDSLAGALILRGFRRGRPVRCTPVSARSLRPARGKPYRRGSWWESSGPGASRRRWARTD